MIKRSTHPSPNTEKHRRRTLLLSPDKDAALARNRAPTVCIATAVQMDSLLSGRSRNVRASASNSAIEIEMPHEEAQ